LDPAAPFQGFAELAPGLYSLQAQPRREAAAGGAACAAPGAKVTALLTRHDWVDPFVQRLLQFRRAPGLVEPDGPPLEPAAQGGQAVAAAAGPAGGRESGGVEHDPGFERSVDAVLEALRRAVAVRCRCIEQQSRQGWEDGEEVASSRLGGLQLGCQGGGGGARRGGAAPAGAQPPALQPPAPVLVLFSGGVDSTLLAALAHEALPPGTPIDLASLCFDGGASPDRLAALDALRELRALAPDRPWRLLAVDCGLGDVAAVRGRLLRLLAPADTVMDLNIGAALWLAARGEGVLVEDEGGRELGGEGSAAPHAGSTAETRQQEAREAARGPQQGAQALAPRQQQQQPPDRGPEAGGTASRRPPAGRGSAGAVRSPARVVLLGHGADELCGGYGRHRTAFRSGGWAGLEAELALDLGRLWLRNLGRDDRLVADHGRWVQQGGKGG
jgi:hypothetical protein